jgi:hypothetical protein
MPFAAIEERHLRYRFSRARDFSKPSHLKFRWNDLFIETNPKQFKLRYERHNTPSPSPTTRRLHPIPDASTPSPTIHSA